jgi:beta-lactamase regulating signal transducer with metallopeptidase domain
MITHIDKILKVIGIFLYLLIYFRLVAAHHYNHKKKHYSLYYTDISKVSLVKKIKYSLLEKRGIKFMTLDLCSAPNHHWATDDLHQVIVLWKN